MINWKDVHGLGKLKLIVKRMIRRDNALHLVDEIVSLASCDCDECSMMANLCLPAYKEKDVHHSALFDEIIDIVFENRSFFALKRYDEYLGTIYGDYMQLPPVEKRVQSHGYHSFFWK